jgi:5-methylcytosine-specific restriction endonuclease McrA
MKNTNKEYVKFKEHPFTFALSDEFASARKKHRRVCNVASCSFCGSMKILGDMQNRNYEKTGRMFCDGDCAAGWKSIYYRSPNHTPMEVQRQETERKQREKKERAEILRFEKEAARKLKPKNKKTAGYYTCTVCGKTEWVESHSQKRFCSKACYAKSPLSLKRKKDAKKNRRHRLRSNSPVSQTITIKALMKKFRGRCKYCNTACVIPEGYNQPNEGTIDHVMPLSKGGLHLWSNVQLLCRSCNTAKRDKVIPGTQMMLRLE